MCCAGWTSVWILARPTESPARWTSHRTIRVALRRGLQFVLSHNLGNGHTCLPAETLIQVAGTLLETDRAALELGLEALAKENELIVCACGGRDFVFLPELYAAETYIAGRMALILSSYPDLGQAYDRQIDALQEQLGITYESRQRKAITMSLNNGVFILTGRSRHR